MKMINIADAYGRLAEDKKGRDIVIMDLSGLTDIADYFVVVSGTSERHVKTIAEGIREGMKKEGVRPFSVEGYDEGRWVILDYHNIVIHVFLESLRELYDLESLWIEAKKQRVEKEKKNIEVGNEERKS